VGGQAKRTLVLIKPFVHRKAFQDIFALNYGISEFELKTALVFWLQHLQPHVSHVLFNDKTHSAG